MKAMKTLGMICVFWYNWNDFMFQCNMFHATEVPPAYYNQLVTLILTGAKTQWIDLRGRYTKSPGLWIILYHSIPLNFISEIDGIHPASPKRDPFSSAMLLKYVRNFNISFISKCYLCYIRLNGYSSYRHVFWHFK